MRKDKCRKYNDLSLHDRGELLDVFRNVPQYFDEKDGYYCYQDRDETSYEVTDIPATFFACGRDETGEIDLP